MYNWSGDWTVKQGAGATKSLFPGSDHKFKLTAVTGTNGSVYTVTSPNGSMASVWNGVLLVAREGRAGPDLGTDLPWPLPKSVAGPGPLPASESLYHANASNYIAKRYKDVLEAENERFERLEGDVMLDSGTAQARIGGVVFLKVKDGVHDPGSSPPHKVALFVLTQESLDDLGNAGGNASGVRD